MSSSNVAQTESGNSRHISLLRRAVFSPHACRQHLPPIQTGHEGGGFDGIVRLGPVSRHMRIGSTGSLSKLDMKAAVSMESSDWDPFLVTCV
jgi:hypothetical protein